MTYSAPLSAQPLRQGRASERSGPLALQPRVRLRSTVSALALATAALSWPVDAARAACAPTLTPSGGQTVTCNSSQPNPVTTGIVAQPGSTNVTVNMLSGAQLNVGGGDAIVLGGGGQVSNSSGAIIQGVRGINITGPATIANDGQIGGNGGPGVLLGGAGDSILTNTGQINGSGTAVQFNTVAGSTQTFNNTGNGSINGNFVGAGDGGIVIVNDGNFNGGITISGNGTNSITTQSGRNINGQVSITGNSQNTIVNAAAFNNGLVISGAGTNSITNQAGAFINQTFTVAGTQNVVDNAGTLNNGLVISGGGFNMVTNRAGATINQTFSLSGSQNIVDNAGTLNNGVTVSGNGVNSITNRTGGVINQAVTVTGTPQSAVANFGTVNGVINMSGTGSVFNEGAINGGIDFTGTPGAGPFTLTLAPGQTINGNVLGTGSDTFQLGSSLISRSLFGTFNVSNIGPGQQYRGFSTFNKIGTSIWTLTGTGAQNWNISGGVLIGDTNSLQGPAITNNAALVFSQNFSGTYAGSIGGSGALTVQGGGAVTFTGSNTYTGGTTINGATLQLGNGVASGSIVGDVVDNGTLVINRSDPFTFGGAISGTGAFVQAGPGTTTLTENNSYAGATTVAAGTLRVSGSIAGSSGVTVNSGATLAGTGTVTGRVASTTINSGGTLAPGDSAVGALIVSGNLVFQSAATYLVQVSPTSASNTCDGFDDGRWNAHRQCGRRVLHDQPGLPGAELDRAADGDIHSEHHRQFRRRGLEPSVQPARGIPCHQRRWRRATRMECHPGNQRLEHRRQLDDQHGAHGRRYRAVQHLDHHHHRHQAARHAGRRPAVQYRRARLHLQRHRNRRRRLLADRIRQRRRRYFRQCADLRGERCCGRARHAAIHQFEHA